MKLIYLSSVPQDQDLIWHELRAAFAGFIMHGRTQRYDPWPIPLRMNARVIYILRARGLDELQAYARVKEIFMDTPLVLILPDQEERTLALGHSLLPRFISYADGSVSGLVDVLEKMVRTAESRPGEGRARA